MKHRLISATIKNAVREALKKHRARFRAARSLGVSRTTLWRWMKRYHIKQPSKTP